MNKKILATLFILVLVVSILGATYYFLVHQPEQKKDKIQSFYEEVDSFESSADKIDAINATINVEDSETSDETVFESLKDLEFEGLSEELSKLKTELEQAETPEEMQETVDELIKDIDSVSNDLESVEELMVYISDLSVVMLDFTEKVEEYNSSINNFDSQDINLIIKKFDQATKDLDTIYNEFQESLNQMDVPPSAETFHSLIKDTFKELQQGTNKVFADLRDVLLFSAKVINTPNALSSAELERAQNLENEIEEILSQLSTLEELSNRFEEADPSTIFDISFSEEELESKLSRIDTNMKKLEQFKEDNL